MRDEREEALALLRGGLLARETILGVARLVDELQLVRNELAEQCHERHRAVGAGARLSAQRR